MRAEPRDAPSGAPEVAKPRPGIPFLPGLEGLRGAALVGVLLFHGLGGKHEDMEPIATGFLAPAGYASLMCDARGHGGTRWDAGDGFDRDTLVADLEGFVDAIGLETFHIAAFSIATGALISTFTW